MVPVHSSDSFRRGLLFRFLRLHGGTPFGESFQGNGPGKRKLRRGETGPLWPFDSLTQTRSPAKGWLPLGCFPFKEPPHKGPPPRKRAKNPGRTASPPRFWCRFSPVFRSFHYESEFFSPGSGLSSSRQASGSEETRGPAQGTGGSSCSSLVGLMVLCRHRVGCCWLLGSLATLEGLGNALVYWGL